MRYIPALKMMAQVADVRPVLMQCTLNNEFQFDVAVKIS